MLTCKTPAEPLSLAEFDASLAALARFETSPLIGVAVSGGPDSLALAILADRWVRERSGQICALTVDHRLRPESGTEALRVKTWLAARGIRHEVLVWAGEKPRSGIQQAARIARYRLLDQWCRAHACLHLLTAHHREDQIETHLIRRRAQSGPDGLAGMSAIRELEYCRVLRPLLGVPKERLISLLNAEHQPFIVDPSNVDPAFERSHYRRSADAVADDVRLSRLAAEVRGCGIARAKRERDGNTLLARYVTLHPAGFAIVDIRLLSAASAETIERLLAEVARTIGGGNYLPRRAGVARLRASLDGAGGRGRTLGGCRFIHSREQVLVIRELARSAQPIELMPGESALWDHRFRIATPAAAHRQWTIGYLGASGVAQLRRLAPELTRSRLPRRFHPFLPAAWDEDGIAAVPHLPYKREGVGAVPQIIFRPVNPLTRASFAVV